MNKEIFHAYDIRGIYKEDFEAKDFYKIAQAYARVVRPRTVVLGHDVRESSFELWEQVAEGLMDAGVDVLNIGAISTDMLYFAVPNYNADGGITISASHNPKEYNGMKLVRKMAIPISRDSGLKDIRDLIFEPQKMEKRYPMPARNARGVMRSVALMEDYLQHLRSFIDMSKLTKKRLVLNANGGLAGRVAERLLEGTPVEIAARIFFEPDGRFNGIPEGRPDPMYAANRAITIASIKACNADLGVAWDADADRCFFFDEKGEFVEGAYITALLAELLLKRHGGGSVVFDPRVIWPVQDRVIAAGGKPLINKCGHSFIKERMRSEDALFGGEASAHYYFRRNFYADNGMIPFLLVLEHLCRTGKPLSEWVHPMRHAYPISGEINFTFATQDEIPAAMRAISAKFRDWGTCHEEEKVDGLSVCYTKNRGDRLWRFNLRASNTEPVIRLNVEAVGDADLLREKTELVATFLESIGGRRKR